MSQGNHCNCKNINCLQHQVVGKIELIYSNLDEVKPSIELKNDHEEKVIKAISNHLGIYVTKDYKVIEKRCNNCFGAKECENCFAMVVCKLWRYEE